MADTSWRDRVHFLVIRSDGERIAVPLDTAVAERLERVD
jgi:hypothetical protein